MQDCGQGHCKNNVTSDQCHKWIPAVAFRPLRNLFMMFSQTKLTFLQTQRGDAPFHGLALDYLSY